MTKSTRWAWTVSLLAGIGVCLVLAFVLSLTTQSHGFYERHFVWLFWVNVAVAVLLFAVIGLAVVRLVTRLRSGKFGGQLLAKLAGIFAVVGLLPGLLIYTVSYQFVSRSIEAWFDVKVASALDAGLALGKGTLDNLVSDLATRTRLAAQRVGDSNEPLTPLALERLREQLDVRDLALLGPAGQVLISAGGSAAVFAPERPSATLLRQARTVRSAAVLEGLDDEAAIAANKPNARVRALAVVPNSGMSLSASEERFLFVVQPLSASTAANALAVQAAYSEYQQRALARDGLRRMYVGTLTLALILAVFGAVLVAVLLGNQLVRPLLLLAEGVRQVAEGDLSAKPVFASRDELGGLTRSFADMTAQLSEAREDVQRGVSQLETARTRLQTILDNLTAGVIVFDREGCIDTANPGATRILRLPISAYVGRKLADIAELQGFANQVWQRFELHASSPEQGERTHWQDAFELPVGTQNTLTLLVRGATLPNDHALMVFDDITEVVSAQRSAAWAEVARRLAHEIKNPLTPIQLSAERLEHRLHQKLEPTEQALLTKSVATIVNQVQAMKQLVNEFRDYARLPAAQLTALDLAELAAEVLALYGQAQEQGRLVARLEAGLPSIMGDATQLRQVIHNLVQNGLDAVQDRSTGRVQLAVAAARGENGEVRAVRLSVVDNGPGFEDKVLNRAFEPYVTTKAKGTGLGLAVVKKIADEHRAQIRITNLQESTAEGASASGARVSLSFSILMPAPQPQASGLPALGPASQGGEATQAH